MVVDASVIVAILTREADADELADALEAARSLITSAIASPKPISGRQRERVDHNLPSAA